MADKKRSSATVAKPYLSGAAVDENTVRNALKFFGVLLMILFMTFLVCTMTGFKSTLLRIAVNVLIEGLVMLILYAKGAELGTEDVARGEILFQHEQKGVEITQKERKIPFNRYKGFMIGLIGSSLFVICAIILAFTSKKQMTGAGVLPSWTDAFMGRSEISGALGQYSKGDPVTFTDILRVIVRIMIMPFISLAGSENRSLLLTMERISPILVLLPAAAYGIGYLQGPAKRRMIHTEIADNNHRRIIKEKKARRQRIAPKGPQQLN